MIQRICPYHILKNKQCSHFLKTIFARQPIYMPHTTRFLACAQCDCPHDVDVVTISSSMRSIVHDSKTSEGIATRRNVLNMKISERCILIVGKYAIARY